MRKLFHLSIFLLAMLYESAYGQKTITSRTFNPIDSSFGLIDSVVIEYFDDVNPVLHTLTFNRDSITISSTFDPVRIVKNADTVKILIDYVKTLFISGKETSVINITYGAQLNFGPTDKITIRLFSAKTDYWTHEIFLAQSNGKIEFSKRFRAFIKFFKSLIKYNQ